MSGLLEAIFALPRLLLADLRSVATNITVVGQVFTALRRMDLRGLILPMFILFAALLPVRILNRILALPYDLVTFASDIKNERLARKIKTEGANIYPLF